MGGALKAAVLIVGAVLIYRHGKKVRGQLELLALQKTGKRVLRPFQQTARSLSQWFGGG